MRLQIKLEVTWAPGLYECARDVTLTLACHEWFSGGSCKSLPHKILMGPIKLGLDRIHDPVLRCLGGAAVVEEELLKMRPLLGNDEGLLGKGIGQDTSA